MLLALLKKETPIITEKQNDLRTPHINSLGQI